MRREDDEGFEVVWNGAKDRAGTCPRLSGYEGPSSLAASASFDSLTPGEVVAIQRALGMRPPRWKGRRYWDLVDEEAA